MKCCRRKRAGKATKGEKNVGHNWQEQEWGDAVWVAIEAIRIGAGHGLSEAKVESFRRNVEKGHNFPPIVLHADYSLEDGRNRLEGHRRAGCTHILCILV